MALLAITCCTLGVLSGEEVGLRDHPILGVGDPLYLEGEWDVQDGKMAIKGTVPGDLMTDLQAAGKMRDPYYENTFNDVETQKLWYNNTWVYSKTFTASSSGAALLVFEGIKMSATIKFDGTVIGTALDQFLRYTYPITVAAGSTHTITVTFDWQEIDGRWMACTGGWDWAPYTEATFPGSDASDPSNVMSSGIWKTVYVVLPSKTTEFGAFVSHFTPQVFYDMGDSAENYPNEAMLPHGHRDFIVKSRVFILHSDALSLRVTATGSWGGFNTTTYDIPAPTTFVTSSAGTMGESVVDITMNAAAGDIDLWWPNGMGAQHLYNVSATFEAVGKGYLGIANREIGFKFLALVTGDDTNSTYVAERFGKEGTDLLGMAFRVNGALMFNRGGNVIPMEEMEGRMTVEAYNAMVASSAEAGMNTFRLWGGGIFPPRAFYEACDRYGVVLYHDVMYAQGGHSPKETATQAEELRHQVRRVSHHPSVAIWDGCNECHVVLNTSTGIYATFVMKTIVEEDMSHPVWPSCPSNGWSGGVDSLTSLPVSTTLLPQTKSGSIETHGPYQHEARHENFRTVNEGGFSNATNAIPPSVKEAPTGISQHSVFASEFGGVVMTSFESIKGTLDSSHWAMFAGQPSGACRTTGDQRHTCDSDNVMQTRNYGCQSMLSKMFGYKAVTQQALNTTGEAEFKKSLYLCMLAQALDMKSDVESRRSQNQFGVILWQLNEIWPTGGWGSLEYGAVNQTGVVIGGRWKPLHYFYQKYLFTDVIISCGTTTCFIKNSQVADLPAGTVSLHLVDITGAGNNLDVNVDYPTIPAQGGSHFFTPSMPAGYSVTTHITVALVTPNGASKPVAENVLIQTYPYALKVNKSVTVSTSIEGAVDEAPLAPIKLTVSADNGVALYIHLTTEAQGRFSDNSFALSTKDGPHEVLFYPFRPDQENILKSSLRTESLNMYFDY